MRQHRRAGSRGQESSPSFFFLLQLFPLLSGVGGAGFVETGSFERGYIDDDDDDDAR